MAGRWKERMKKMARANERARTADTKRMTVDRAAKVLEGLLTDPPGPPRPRADHPISLSHRRRKE